MSAQTTTTDQTTTTADHDREAHAMSTTTTTTTTEAAHGPQSAADATTAHGPTEGKNSAQRPAHARPEADSGPALVELPADALACGACGVTVDDSPAAQRESYDVHPLGGHLNPHVPVAPLTFTLCRTCADRRDLARAVATAHPALVARYGHVAPDRVQGALDGLAALGLPMPQREALTRDRAHVLQLIHAIGPAGAAARFAARFIVAGPRPPRSTGAAAHPWSHLEDDDRAELSDGRARLLAYRVAQHRPPQAITPPDGGGCLMCGVSAITCSAVKVVTLGGTTEAARQLWTERRVPASNLGARRTRPGDMLTGYTCPACTEAVGQDHTVTTSGMARALTRYLRATGGPRLDSATVSGVVGWGLLAARGEVPSTGGQPEPWSHVTLMRDDAEGEVARRA